MIVSDNMTEKKTIQDKLAQVHNLMKGLPAGEREIFRNHLLSWLLFENFDDKAGKPDGTLSGLSEKERELILKLAKQTEELHRIMKSESDEDKDQ